MTEARISVIEQLLISADPKHPDICTQLEIFECNDLFSKRHLSNQTLMILGSKPSRYQRKIYGLEYIPLTENYYKKQKIITKNTKSSQVYKNSIKIEKEY